jgi:hypothetical protein
VDRLLRTLLRRLECNPPRVSRVDLGGGASRLEQLGLIVPAEPARGVACQHCDGPYCLPVEFVRHVPSGTLHGYISCSQCGLSQVDPRQLDRWRVSAQGLLASVVSGLAGAARSPTVVIEEKLWSAGKLHLAGQLRECFFAVRVRSAGGQDVAAEHLRSRPRCVVWVPSEEAAARWGAASSALVISLESITSLGESGIEVDRSLLEERIASHFGAQRHAPAPKRRSSRLGDIEALERELAEHLRAARDHAVMSRDLTGAPRLLPRPTRQELARRAGVSASSVTRCLHDAAGEQLRRMWELAGNLESIIAYRARSKAARGPSR